MKAEGIKDKVTLTSQAQEFQKLKKKVQSSIDGKQKSSLPIESVSPPLRLDLALGKAIHSELNPKLIEKERREKIEKIKEMIGKGTYKPELESVAVKVLAGLGDEVSLLRRFAREV